MTCSQSRFLFFVVNSSCLGNIMNKLVNIWYANSYTIGNICVKIMGTISTDFVFRKFFQNSGILINLNNFKPLNASPHNYKLSTRQEQLYLSKPIQNRSHLHSDYDNSLQW